MNQLPLTYHISILFYSETQDIVYPDEPRRPHLPVSTGTTPNTAPDDAGGRSPQKNVGEELIKLIENAGKNPSVSNKYKSELSFYLYSMQ